MTALRSFLIYQRKQQLVNGKRLMPLGRHSVKSYKNGSTLVVIFIRDLSIQFGAGTSPLVDHWLVDEQIPPVVTRQRCSYKRAQFSPPCTSRTSYIALPSTVTKFNIDFSKLRFKFQKHNNIYALQGGKFSKYILNLVTEGYQ